MTSSALLGAASIESLERAWRRMFARSTRTSRRSSGVDNQTILDFDANHIAYCRDLSRIIRRDLGFPFSPLRAFFVPKSSGGERVICIPTVRDRVVQRAISDFLASGDRCRLQNEVSFGFLPGRSVEKAVKQAIRLRSAKRWAYKADIASFFDSIPREVLTNAIRRHVLDRSLHRLLIQASCCEIAVANLTQENKLRSAGIRVGHGIRQGMPLSPFFANLVLRRFDETIHRSEVPMVRYADDLICFADAESACIAVHETVKRALAREDLSVPEPGAGSKTRIYEPDQAAEFLGLGLRPESGTYVLEVSADQTAKIRQKIGDLADIAQLTRAGLKLGGFFRRLDGAIAGYEGAYAFANNAAHLDAVLSTAKHDAVTRLFEKELGIPIAALTQEKRRFIGLDD